MFSFDPIGDFGLTICLMVLLLMLYIALRIGLGVTP
jgi:hypothetical protein